MGQAIFNAIKKATEVTRDKFGIEIKPHYLGTVAPDYKLFSKSYAELHTPITIKYPHSSVGRSYQMMAAYYLKNDTKPVPKLKESPISKIMRLFSHEQEVYATH